MSYLTLKYLLAYMVCQIFQKSFQRKSKKLSYDPFPVKGPGFPRPLLPAASSCLGACRDCARGFEHWRLPRSSTGFHQPGAWHPPPALGFSSEMLPPSPVPCGPQAPGSLRIVFARLFLNSEPQVTEINSLFG